MTTPYIAGFTGKEIDDAILKVYNHDLSMIGFVELKSSPMNPVNLDLVDEPGNYYIRYFINGHTEMQHFSPINLNVTYRNNVMIQTVTVADAVFKREEQIRVFSSDEVHEMGPWTMVTAGTAVKIEAEPVPEIGPQAPSDPAKLGSLWIDTSDPNVNVIKFWNGEEYEGISFIDYEANAPGVATGPIPPTEDVTVGTLWIDTTDADNAVLKYYTGTVSGWVPVSVGAGDVTVTTRAAVEIGPDTPTENLVAGLLWVDTSNPAMVVLKYCDGTNFLPINISANNVRVANL